MHFLKLHSSSLRRLELSNITLLGGEDRRECWVRLIKHLKTELKLASISFSGWFSNGGRQQWSVAKDTVGVERLKARVENYVVDRRSRDCPLEPVAIRPNEGDVEKPANGEEFEGDLTWTMVYSRSADHVDWQPTEPSFGINSNAVSLHSSESESESGELIPTPQSDSDSWGVLEDPDSHSDVSPAVEITLPSFELLVDPGATPTEPQTYGVMSKPPLQGHVPYLSMDHTTGNWTPISPPFMA